MRVLLGTCLTSCLLLACSGSETAGNVAVGGAVDATGGALSSGSMGGNLGTGGILGGSGGSTTNVAQSGGAASGTTSSVSLGGNSTSTTGSIGGLSNTGGASASGGSSAIGSTKALGGASSSGGSKAVGGSAAAGGTKASGGTSSSGGMTASGGTKASGGTSSSGGSKAAGGTSTSGGSATGGTSSSTGFQPCPTNGSACILLPFGDSITDGVGSTDASGYRSPLYKLIVAASQKATFVGSRSSGPAQVSGVTFPPKHEGHPGWTIDSGYVSFGQGISTLIPSPAFNTLPHIVLLMIGTNDVGAATGTDKVAERLDVLLGKIVAVAPNALVVVAQITPIRWNPAALGTYNSKIPGVVQARAASGQHLISVDMSKMPATSLGSDGIHPNDAGYTYMAGQWYTAIQGYLQK